MAPSLPTVESTSQKGPTPKGASGAKSVLALFDKARAAWV